ncbi:outer membrane lipoprotein-sorting protein [Fontimonas sp. SYSU GA230001]|uniref:outer membrane lipoprotein-sorting protein n=1 Tax=Fontimonas sp. SYSU GA230001 TaxID=3142450 RepID=UPI0032B51FF5
MKSGTWLGAGLTAMAAACGPVHAQGELPDLLACMRANVPEQGRIQDLELTTHEGESVRQLKARLYGREQPGELSLTLQVRAPADLRGAAWLFRRRRARDGRVGDETFVYLPSVGRVRRVSGGGEDQRLFGTALSFEDVYQLLSSFSGGAMSLGPASEIAGRPVRRISILAAPDTPASYDRIVAEVDRASCVVVAAELSRHGQVQKRLYAAPDAQRRLGSHWYPSLVTVEDRRKGIRTELRVLQAELSPRPPSRYFEPASFFRE